MPWTSPLYRASICACAFQRSAGTCCGCARALPLTCHAPSSNSYVWPQQKAPVGTNVPTGVIDTVKQHHTSDLNTATWPCQQQAPAANGPVGTRAAHATSFRAPMNAKQKQKERRKEKSRQRAAAHQAALNKQAAQVAQSLQNESSHPCAPCLRPVFLPAVHVDEFTAAMILSHVCIPARALSVDWVCG